MNLHFDPGAFILLIPAAASLWTGYKFIYTDKYAIEGTSFIARLYGPSYRMNASIFPRLTRFMYKFGQGYILLGFGVFLLIKAVQIGFGFA